MDALVIYSLKVSVCLSVIYLFYYLVLRNLTFYNWNRWYLLGFSVLSFFLPFINIADLIVPTQTMPARLITYVPALESYTSPPPGLPVMAVTNESATLNPWEIVLFIFLSGIFVLLVKMGMQLFSYRQFKKSAQLVSNGRIKVYQVNQPISPFSFGRAVFLNRSLHSKAELAEIIRHEFVHVKQGHTLDIIWGEIMCILNWYNPFAWLLRQSLRQNLEFIADNQVVLSGINKKQYQYLLLKVTGTPEFYLTNQFSFLSLKKRIAMMNKMPNTKAHLVKFLLVLPLLIISLLAFRRVNKNNSALSSENKVTSVLNPKAVMVAPTSNDVPNHFNGLKNINQDEKDLRAAIRETDKTYLIFKGNSYVVTDQGGSATTDEFTDIVYVDGKRMTGEEVNKTIRRSSIVAVGGAEKEAAKEKYGLNKPILEIYINTKPPQFFNTPKPNKGTNKKQPGKNSFNTPVSNRKLIAQQNPASLIDAKNIVDIKPGEKQIVNVTFKDGTHEKYDLATETGKQAYEKAQRLTVGGYSAKDPIRYPEDYKAFLNRNPQVKKVRWRFDRAVNSGKPDLVVLTLKSGSEEIYNLKNNAETEVVEKKYGKLPRPPYAPPRVDIIKFSKNTQQKAGAKQFEPPTIVPDQLPADHKDFLARNPQVKTVGWQGKEQLVLFLKSGKQEIYNLNKDESKAEAIKKYGKLPKTPFPPPPAKKESSSKNKPLNDTASGLTKVKFKVKDGLEDKYDLIYPPAIKKEPK